jgi:hypothetical protein
LGYLYLKACNYLNCDEFFEFVISLNTQYPQEFRIWLMNEKDYSWGMTSQAELRYRHAVTKKLVELKGD